MANAKQVEEELIGFVETTVKRLTTNLTELLFENTPELTGFAETNWLPTIGEPALVPAGSKQNVSRAQQEAGVAVVQALYRYPAIVYITNPVEYIVDLNQGSSTKAPAGFVQTTIAQAIRNAI